MDAQIKPHLTPAEYLAIERRAETRSEYLDGEMFAMTGGSRNRNLIVLNIGRELSLQPKKRPCEVYVSDQRVRVPATGLYTYPMSPWSAASRNSTTKSSRLSSILRC